MLNEHPQMKWVFAFQFPIVETVVLIVTEITLVTGSYCEGSLSIHFANLWVGYRSSGNHPFLFADLKPTAHNHPHRVDDSRRRGSSEALQEHQSPHEVQTRSVEAGLLQDHCCSQCHTIMGLQGAPGTRCTEDQLHMVLR